MSYTKKSPSNDDVAIGGWAGLTTRIAWTLLCHKVSIRPQVLRDARDHVLFHLPPDCPLPQAEDLAEHLTTQFIFHARGEQYQAPWPQDSGMPLSPRWRKAIEISLSPLSEAVFKLHYCSDQPSHIIEKRLKVDVAAIEATKGGLREVIRQIASGDGISLNKWPTERVDRLLRRLASYCPNPCPPLATVLRGGHQDHVHQCVRCERTLRLISARILSVEDLVPPQLGARPTKEVCVLVLHFQPEGRHYRDALLQELPHPSIPLGSDILFVDGANLEDVDRTLSLATEIGRPPRHQIRGKVLNGPGCWSRHGLLGPLGSAAKEQVLATPWGSIEGIGSLPEALPQPPMPKKSWAVVAALALLTLTSAYTVTSIAEETRSSELKVVFNEGRGGIWAHFNTRPLNHVALISTQNDTLSVQFVTNLPGDLQKYATGDGSYLTHTPGTGIIVIANPEPFQELNSHLRKAEASKHPAHTLSKILQEKYPFSTVDSFLI